MGCGCSPYDEASQMRRLLIICGHSTEFSYMYLLKEWIIFAIFCLGSAYLMYIVEGGNEEKLIEQVIRPHRYQLIRDLRNLSIILPDKASEGEWEGAAMELIMKYERVAMDVNKTNSYLSAYPDGKTWTIWNSIVYCATIYTTIGYGHICPTTTTGRALTIVYSIIGIPLFLIALTDFGKLFTRGIKFIWSFVRRVYYTGNCRRYRKTAHVQEIFKGAQMMYDIATFRRPSTQIDLENQEQLPPPPPPTLGSTLQPPNTSTTGTLSNHDSTTTTPTTPNISNYEIDDEFNLPISVALFILVSYIFIGAVIYSAWEGWKFFISFYFVFISMSTIGFGDYVPKEPICMIVSIVYLVFGLALMSMCINVVQEKLSDTFKQASNKIGMSIGLEMSESGSVITADNIEVVPIHGISTNSMVTSTDRNVTPLDVDDDDDDDGVRKSAGSDARDDNDGSKKNL